MQQVSEFLLDILICCLIAPVSGHKYQMVAGFGDGFLVVAVSLAQKTLGAVSSYCVAHLATGNKACFAAEF